MPQRKPGQVETGKRWVEEVFEHISTERRDSVAIVRCTWQDNDPEYHLRFQIAGQDEETLSFTRGTLKTCGKSGHNAVRQRIEAAIRERLTRRATGAACPAPGSE
jgi:hypothetical protein